MVSSSISRRIALYTFAIIYYINSTRRDSLSYMIARDEDLTRRDKADLLLVTATEVETRAVLNMFLPQNSTFVHRYIDDSTYFDLGVIGGARTFLVQSEMGAGGPAGAT